MAANLDSIFEDLVLLRTSFQVAEAQGNRKLENRLKIQQLDLIQKAAELMMVDSGDNESCKSQLLSDLLSMNLQLANAGEDKDKSTIAEQISAHSYAMDNVDDMDDDEDDDDDEDLFEMVTYDRNMVKIDVDVDVGDTSLTSISESECSEYNFEIDNVGPRDLLLTLSDSDGCSDLEDCDDSDGDYDNFEFDLEENVKVSTAILLHSSDVDVDNLDHKVKMVYVSKPSTQTISVAETSTKKFETSETLFENDNNKWSVKDKIRTSIVGRKPDTNFEVTKVVKLSKSCIEIVPDRPEVETAKTVKRKSHDGVTRKSFLKKRISHSSLNIFKRNLGTKAQEINALRIGLVQDTQSSTIPSASQVSDYEFYFDDLHSPVA